MSDWFAAVGLCLVALTFVLLLKTYRAEYALLISLAAGVAIMLMLWNDLSQTVSTLQLWMERVPSAERFGGLLIKALVVGLITQSAADVCRDAGDASLANKSEFVGKIVITVLSLPIFSEILQIVENLVGKSG